MPIVGPKFLTGQNLAFDRPADLIPARLTEHASRMKQGVYQVADSFYVAVGYGIANMTMVVGSDGVILIDSLDIEDGARQALSDLRRVSDKPVRALVYTHSHPDHTSGARALVDPAALEAGRVEIYAHERLMAGMYGNPSYGVVPPLRLAYTFGFTLDQGPEGWVEAGLGPPHRAGKTGFLPPTKTFRGSLDVTVAGIRMRLQEAPSESDDELAIWFPDHRVLHVADVVQGETLANLYALRGAVRDPLQWVRAVDLLRQFDAEFFIAGHGRPLAGREEIRELLLSYRDALQYIHDQAVRLLARGLTPDELAEAIPELPPRLRAHPWLGEFYGTVRQTVRQQYFNSFGWFEGDPTFLAPLPRAQRSARYVAAMGGPDAVVANATQAHADGQFQWAAELLTHILRADPDHATAKELKAHALRQLGYQATNPIWRNNYLMAAKEVDGTLDRAKLLGMLRQMGNPDVAAAVPIPVLLRALATRLDPVKCDGVWLTVGFRCSDTGAAFGIAVRPGVAEILTEAPASAAATITTTEPVLRGLLTGRVSWPRAVADRAALLEPGVAEVAARFWSVFDPPNGDLPALACR